MRLLRLGCGSSPSVLCLLRVCETLRRRSFSDALSPAMTMFILRSLSTFKDPPLSTWWARRQQSLEAAGERADRRLLPVFHLRILLGGASVHAGR